MRSDEYDFDGAMDVIREAPDGLLSRLLPETDEEFLRCFVAHWQKRPRTATEDRLLTLAQNELARRTVASS